MSTLTFSETCGEVGKGGGERGWVGRSGQVDKRAGDGMHQHDVQQDLRRGKGGKEGAWVDRGGRWIEGGVME